MHGMAADEPALQECALMTALVGRVGNRKVDCGALGGKVRPGNNDFFLQTPDGALRPPLLPGSAVR